MYLALEIGSLIWRIAWFPIKAAAFVLRTITYLVILGIVAGVLYGLWSSGVRPW